MRRGPEKMPDIDLGGALRGVAPAGRKRAADDRPNTGVNDVGAAVEGVLMLITAADVGVGLDSPSWVGVAVEMVAKTALCPSGVAEAAACEECEPNDRGADETFRDAADAAAVAVGVDKETETSAGAWVAYMTVSGEAVMPCNEAGVGDGMAHDGTESIKGTVLMGLAAAGEIDFVDNR